jgi:hypothetical protein
MSKGVQAKFAKGKNLCEGMFIDYKAPQFIQLTKHRNDGGCRHSKNAPAPCPQYQPSEKILILFFLSLGKLQSISALAFRRLPFTCFTTILDLQLRYALALLFCQSMLSPHSDRIVSSQLSEPLSTLKNGKLRSTSFAMNLFSAVILPVSLCTTFLDCGGFICTMVLILFGLASIPFTDSRQSRTLPLCMPNTHFSGLSFNCALRILTNVSAKSYI